MNITDKEFKDFSIYMKQNYGINLTEAKKGLVDSRLSMMIDKQGFESFTQYFESVKADKSGEAISDLINRITTNYTYFWREEDHFIYLMKTVLPYLEEKYNTAKDIRAWSAGCSSGEEPYTLQMLLKEQFPRGWDTKLLATDISIKAMSKAEAAVYPIESTENMPPHLKNKYFKKVDGNSVRVVDLIKSDVIFKKFNLMDPFPFKKKFHFIFCRNVMIYFDADTKRKLIDKYYNALESGGYLFIGHSESVDRQFSEFKYIMPALYRKG